MCLSVPSLDPVSNIQENDIVPVCSMYTPVWFNHLLPNKPSTVMKDSRIQSPGASELTGNSKHNPLRRDSDQALLTDCIYLASIASFLIKKIILLEKSSQPFQNIAVSCYPNTATELIPTNCLGALVAFSSSLAGVQGWQIYKQQIKEDWQSYPILHWTCLEHKDFLCSEVSPTANHNEILELVPTMSLKPVFGALTGAEDLCTGQRAAPVPAAPHWKLLLICFLLAQQKTGL